MKLFSFAVQHTVSYLNVMCWPPTLQEPDLSLTVLVMIAAGQ